MKVFFDGLDIRTSAFDFFEELKINSFAVERKSPFLNSSRYCFPYPFLPFFNFVYYPKNFLKKNSIDLIYAFKVFPLNDFPWIADVEEFHYWSAFYSFFSGQNFFSSVMNSVGRKLVSKAFNSFNCRALLPWTQYSKKSILFFAGNHLKEKTRVIYPSMKPSTVKKKTNKEKISLLFTATNPVFKGTNFVFSAFNMLKKKYDVELNCFGNFSAETKKRFPEINFGFVSGKEFREKVMPENDILLMPSLIESFGLTAVEAFSCSVPVVSSDIMGLNEINEENRTGFKVNFPEEYHKKIFLNPYYFFGESKKLDSEKIAVQLAEKTALLIEDSSLRKKFGRNAFRDTEKGRFSFNERKKAMKEIFNDFF